MLSGVSVLHRILSRGLSLFLAGWVFLSCSLELTSLGAREQESLLRMEATVFPCLNLPSEVPSHSAMPLVPLTSLEVNHQV